ncbi:MAG: hypothetical protein K2M00_04710 [Muribaculaceae bacterium]|nr:hypothetical protein [Muribaculaceae bacterium]
MDKKEIDEKALRDYPGAETDAADDNKVTRKEVEQQTCEMNNNPRNNDLQMP